MPVMLGKKRIGASPPSRAFSPKPQGNLFSCPKCGNKMIQVDLAQLSGGNVFITLECMACHYRLQQKR